MAVSPTLSQWSLSGGLAQVPVDPGRGGAPVQPEAAAGFPGGAGLPHGGGSVEARVARVGGRTGTPHVGAVYTCGLGSRKECDIKLKEDHIGKAFFLSFLIILSKKLK